jgi:hypothetical protein
MAKIAHLNGRLTEELYMKQPVGFQDGTGRVCRLICGLKQVENVWNDANTVSIPMDLNVI